MSRAREPRIAGKYFWLVCNWGTVWDIFKSRRDALEFARRTAAENGYTRETWQELFEIHKVRVQLWAELSEKGKPQI